jgi:hypothetical protein
MPRNLAAAPTVEPPRGWKPMLGLEQLAGAPPAPSSSHAAPDWLGRLEFADDVAAPIQAPPHPAPQTDAAEDAGPDWLGRLEFADDDPPAAAAVAADSEPQPAGGRKTGAGSRPAKRGRTVIGGSLLKADGTSEPSMVGML